MLRDDSFEDARRVSSDRTNGVTIEQARAVLEHAARSALASA